MTIDAATERQIIAANPVHSTWLSANAGSGKTRVLTNRAARLLLEGVAPQNILCLTYTKAAASEMQNRLFQRLGNWSMMPDAQLIKELENLGAPPLQGAGALDFARTLFARAIDTPGGLRIQTIHSFCASLLRRFPLEAGVSPVFREMDERAARKLREDVLEKLATTENAALVSDLAAQYSGEDLGKLATEAVRHRRAVQRPKNAAGVWAQFDLSPGFCETDLFALAFCGGEPELVAALIRILQASEKSTDRAAAGKLAAINMTTPTGDDLIRLSSIFLFGANAKNPHGAKVGSFPTRGIQQENPEIITRLDEFMRRIEVAREQHARLSTAQKTLVFYKFAAAFCPLYETAKAERACLDFDDLIQRAGALLSDPSVAQWVLFRLDGGLDHILVDEAQDTSPDQWKVIELLAQEFSAGIGARPDIARTIFVVGDFKQSIYSFQGADPRIFDQMRRHFSKNLASSKQTLFEQSLEHSFRSSPAILSLVDKVFQQSGGRGVGGQPNHLAFYETMPGRVDLWNIVAKSEPREEKNWYDPTDKLAANNHRVVLAEKIAAQIATMVETGSIADDSGAFRRIQYGDFLILVQQRSELFHQIIRACKLGKLPIAGADRLKISAELAVRDLQALLAFLALPQDSLSLAAALRSPLLGISEAELFDLAHSRAEKDLWPALKRREQEFREIVGLLADLQNQVDFLSPYELLERILTRHGGRARLLARLGPEAEDGIDALLAQAITYEALEPASLTGFLVWLESDGTEIKRQSESAGDRIRVMTTHGAKGLESPIVILPDTGDRKAAHFDEILPDDDGSLMWRVPTARQPKIMTEIITQANQASNDERARLLYVALTRAEKWLIVCASGNVKENGDSWYRLVQNGMTAVGAAEFDTPTGPGLRSEHGNWLDAMAAEDKPEPRTATRLPPWIHTHSPAPKQKIITISPSNMGGDKSIAGEVEHQAPDFAARRGRQIHSLLEHLPQSPKTAWPDLARQLLSAGADRADGQELDSLLAETASVINAPPLAFLFAPEVLCETEISAGVDGPGPLRIRGTIDRLVVTPTTVTIVDFKSNHLIPATPSQTPTGILRQMAAYLMAIEKIYPKHQIDLAIVWTRTAALMPLSHDIVRAALNSPPHLDVARPAP